VRQLLLPGIILYIIIPDKKNPDSALAGRDGAKKTSFRPIPPSSVNYGGGSRPREAFTVIAIVCQHENRKKFGKTSSGAPRMRCKDCGKTWTESTATLDGMKIGVDRAAQIIEMLCEGMSLRAVSRLTDTHLQTITDLLVMVGERCETFMAEQIKGVQVDDVQVDEIWGYVFCKQATAARLNYVGGCGDTYCFTAIERHTKLLVAWHHGRRTMEDTNAFCRKLNVATSGRFQLSTDGFAPYEHAVAWNLGQRVDYGQVVKIFGSQGKEEQRKYSPAKIIGMKRTAVAGHPAGEQICTSHVERMNGSIRHFTKRMTRLTCAFSKRWNNHKAALALFFAHYNFCRKHRSLKGHTPAMAHGLATEVWSVRDLLKRIAPA
jgi:IS1 family transposase/transposase-like protein